MLTVACVLKSGGIYDERWVANLKHGVWLNLHIPYKFVCLTDMAPECDVIPLEHDWPGWWAKLELFKLPGPLLYLDLDTLIVGDLKGLVTAAYGEAFTTLGDFYLPNKLASGIMVWRAEPPPIYNLFTADVERLQRVHRGRGDQAFIASCESCRPQRYLQDLLPGQIVSYKKDIAKTASARPTRGEMLGCGELPAGARVICLHGAPKFTDFAPDFWMRRQWEQPNVAFA